MARRPSRIEKSAGGVVLRRIDGEPHVLLIRDPYHRWGLPKGHLEDGESARNAALREVREETGLSDLTVGQPVGTIDWHFHLEGRSIHKYCEFFLMSSEVGEPVPEAAEGITACRWVPLADAVARVGYENAREVVRTARRLVAGQAVSAP